MEDASDEHSSVATEMPVPTENGSISADYDTNTDERYMNKLNGGDTNSDDSDSERSSGSVTPVTNTDSENNLKRKLATTAISSPESDSKILKKFKCEDTAADFVPPTNPYFNESLFELSGFLQQKNSVDNNGEDDNDNVKNGGGINGLTTNDIQDSEEALKPNELLTRPKRLTAKKRKPINQKVHERPQLLGLQPLIQFKCRKCSRSGFSSLQLLKEHFKHCTGEPVENQKSNNTSKKLLVTRRSVFLCSACGCYYENYNLFLHVYKVHKRFVCLYCSAVFSNTDKFLFHLLTKHNCVPKQLNTEKDFFESHKQPCYLMCCECEKIFGDENEEHFYGHACSATKLKDSKNNKLINNTNNNNKVLVNNHKPVSNKSNNNNKLKSKEFVEHVTGDTETTSLVSNSSNIQDLEPRETVTEPVPDLNSHAPSPSAVAAETENETALVTTETTQNDAETNPSNYEDNDDVPNSNNENDYSGNELDDNVSISSPEHVSEDQSIEDEHNTEQQQQQEEEIRKVPKVTLKLRKRQPSLDEHADDVDVTEHEESDDSDKLTMELDNTNLTVPQEEEPEKEPAEPTINVAGADIPVTELELEQPLDKFDTQTLLQKCLRLTIPSCVYCNHARKISVNGKQLGLHAIAEHRFSAVVNSITAEELIPESFVMRLKEGLPELQDVYFSLESQTRDESLTFPHVFECFQCRYATSVHKELYLHNRKMHAKSILLCIMCKSNFYSYSELTCHLCPGLYEQNNEISFRCCICESDDLPSAFRLMVHLRKRHNACDVCLEQCHNQSRLSNHVWKHKLHHFCYRCGIAYRNKPDITKHLFWKHGTESVLCKKCLQKKWPHVYHFCMPPTTFTCEECNLNFTKAVALKVHKRLHTNEKPHTCTFENCTESFISKKLLLKHEFKHREPTEAQVIKPTTEINNDTNTLSICNTDENNDQEASVSEVLKDEPKPKLKVDVLDLPALNLSESDSSDSEDEVMKKVEEPPSTSSFLLSQDDTVPKSEDETTQSSIVVSSAVEQVAPVLENIWDNFKNYQAQKEKPSISEIFEDNREGINEDTETTGVATVEEDAHVGNDSKGQKELIEAIMQDHDYSLLSQVYKTEPQPEVLEQLQQSMDHDYCTQKHTDDELQPMQEQQPTTSKEAIKDTIPNNSSSDSDSSSCSCGPDCSCSSGSSTSSSDSSDSDSSTSEGRRKQQIRREQRKQRSKVKKESETSHIDVVATDPTQPVVPSVELIIEETDLETTESETDEDFYDKQPQKIANKLLAEKRKELMMLADLGPLVNGSVLESSRPSTPSLPETEIAKLKPKKSKSKKKKRKSKKRDRLNTDVPSTVYQYSTVSPLSISLPKNSPMSVSTPSLMTPPILSTLTAADFNSDLSNASDSLRASKRRRIPNKFYGYSSDEEQEKHEKIEKHLPPVLKWRKADLPSPAPPPLLVPPITLKAIPSPAIEQEPVPVQPSFHHPHPALFKPKVHDATESNDSTSEDEQTMPTMNKPLNQPPLYCYCRCPYDEVSEMIGCDADDCLIEWFHFECVGIMVPPKGQWFCPDCRKKRQQRRELSQL